MAVISCSTMERGSCLIDSTLIATSLPEDTSKASHTSPNPPLPSDFFNRYLDSNWERGISPVVHAVARRAHRSHYPSFSTHTGLHQLKSGRLRELLLAPMPQKWRSLRLPAACRDVDAVRTEATLESLRDEAAGHSS